VKQENRERKAGNTSISHDEAMRISGHDHMGLDRDGESMGGMTKGQWNNVRVGREMSIVAGMCGPLRREPRVGS
jgi:hypothetical protein